MEDCAPARLCARTVFARTPTRKVATMADADCFERLASLVDQLPAMEKASARLRRAEAAQAALAAQRELAEAEGLLAAADRQIAEVEQAQARAAREGDLDFDAELATRTLLFWGQQRGLHVGPANNARAHLAQALRAGGFSDVAEAEAALLPDDEHDELAERIAHYQRDYTEALAACEEVEGDSGAAADTGREL